MEVNLVELKFCKMILSGNDFIEKYKSKYDAMNESDL